MNACKLGEELRGVGIVPNLVHSLRFEADVGPHDHVGERAGFSPTKEELLAASVLVEAAYIIDRGVATDV